jgi:N-acetylglutamate synthase-like GNAT family acetyltransferase
LKIRSAKKNDINKLAELCVPPDRRSEPYFRNGINLKKEYLKERFKKEEEIAKIAVEGEALIGMIQYQPRPAEQVIEIQCIFVPDDKHRKKGIGKRLLKELIKDAQEFKEYFNNNKPKSLITYAFEAHSGYSQHKFYQKYGFKKINENNDYYLYYPLVEGYQYKPKVGREAFKALPEDKDRVLIFIDPFCPFCYTFAKETEKLIKKAKDQIEVQFINILTQKQEVQKRGGIVLDCVVNQKPINEFFMEKEAFLKDVRKAFDNK